MRIETMKKPDRYGAVLIFAVLVLFALMLGTLYKINQQKEDIAYTPSTVKQHGFIVPPMATTKKIVLLSSRQTAQFYMQNGSSVDAYSQKIKKFSSLLSETGYKTTILPMEKVTTLDKDSIAFVLDAQVISQKHKEALRAFVQDGGSLFFNFLAGFTDEKGVYKGEGFVKQITHLNLSQKGFASFNQGLSITPKILSPFSEYMKRGELLNVAIYDKLPIYNQKKDQYADIYASSYDQVRPPVTKNRELAFKNSEAGLAWHGYLGKGKWVYTSLPSYSFFDINKNRDAYKKLLSGMISFLSHKALVQPYPYIDQDSAVFISEDTEYKFENFERFADLSAEYKIPVTAFIVASLANLPEHEEMMNRIKKNPFVEFASHSTTHKKIVGESEAFIINETKNSKTIIDQKAPVAISGFRPPREELNLLMKQHLAKSGFTYVLGANKSYLYPRADEEDARLIYIPRHGTDDYSYLVNLDWDQKEIVNLMKKESDFVTKLNGIYTLSVHTHLFSYSSNIEIIRSFYKHLQQHPELKVLNGREIVKRVLQHNNIEHSTKMLDNQLIVTVKNNNSEAVKNLHLKIFKNPAQGIIDGQVSDGLKVTIFEHNNAIIIDSLPANSETTLYITLAKE